MVDELSPTARVLRFRTVLSRRSASAVAPRPASPVETPAPRFPERHGVPVVPAPPQPYHPTNDWGEDTPEEIRVVDTLLVWLAEARLQRESWCFSRHLVSRSWSGSTPGSNRRVVRCSQGRGHEARAYLWELTGNLVVKGVWRRVIEVVWRQRVGRYALIPGAEAEPSGTILVEQVTSGPWKGTSSG